MTLWMPEELLSDFLEGVKLPRRKKAFLKQHLLRLSDDLSADEALAFERMNCHTDR